MNRTVRLLISFTLLLLVCDILTAASPYVIKKDGKKLSATKITSDSKGVLTVKTGSVATKIKPRDYKYARIPMPADIKKAAKDLGDKKYAAAAEALKKLYPKYKYLGWDVFCIYGAAKALNENGQKSAAIAQLELLTKKPVDPAKMNYYMHAQKLLAELYADSGKYSQAEKILKILSTSNDDSLVAFSNNIQGDMLMKQGKTMDAKLMYMTTALLFDAKNRKERPEALVKIINILRSEKNNKALDFKKKLENDYPGTKYLNDL